MYIFEEGSKRYLLRPSSVEAFEAQTIASDLGLAPSCTRKDESHVIMPFIEGHPLGPSDLARPGMIERLGEMIATLHRYEGEYPDQGDWKTKELCFFDEVTAKGTATPSRFREILVGIERSDRPRLPSHYDLHGGNIVVDGDEIAFIDWDCASLADPFYDLAYLSVTAEMTKEQDFVLLSACKGCAATEEEWCELEVMKGICCLRIAFWWFLHAESDEERATPLDGRRERLDRIASVFSDLPIKRVGIHSEEKWFVLLRGLLFWHRYEQYAERFPERLGVSVESREDDAHTCC